MPPGRQERQRRRKITLACEPCRERKARCDGGKPICSTCQRRSLALEHCVYTVNNARTACSDDYTKTLHERIRKLEQACTSHGIDINTLEVTAQDAHGSAADNISSTAARTQDFTALDAACAMDTSDDQAAVAAAQLPSPYSSVGVDGSSEARRVTAMGTILAEDDLEDSPNNLAEPDFYGSSSAVAFLKEAYSAMNSAPARVQPSNPFRSQQALPSLSTPSSLYADFDKFLLPPRPFADYLLQLYFQKVHYLYPVFHRPAFERAYESLWQPTTSTTAAAVAASEAGETDFRGVGLGCSPGADATTIVFHSALNSIFALACNFADLTCAEKAKSIEVFLLRSRKCLSVDLLEKNNLGVVQTLLLCGLVFQGTPFPDRCWNAVGIACRIAQGLGLHMDVVAARDMRAGLGAEEEGGFTLEMDVRQRTWQGCVILDTLVSMTFGRPTVTSNLSANELLSRSHSGADQSLEQPKLEFITQSFKLSLILENILSQVYQAWRNRYPAQRASCGTRGGGGGGGIGGLSFDAIVELDSKLTDFEDLVPPLLSWGGESEASVLDGVSSPDDLRILATQKHVLHARFLYLRLMLHRPILTDLSAEYARPHRDTAGGRPSSEAASRSRDKGLRAPFLTECARACVDAAMQLIDLVQGSYQTDTTGAWWWNSLYACAAGLVLIVCRLCPRLWTGLDHTATSASWEQCQGILQGIAAFSVSARKSLDLLRKIDGAVTQLQAAREPSGQQMDPEMNCASGLEESWSLPADIDVSLLLEPDPMSFFRGWEVMGYETLNS
ncbi:fungal specific transcription factor domain-containing protein [Colletotrichum tamarilloi]|uniref:Fungal specific transcription factor domain-containing protein n=1 Tax=Colletotrichum tamarilloi TaxID=1209934 RepID=A0ABQ9RGP2_9PEZI|nr:fungal specific transcription factor domain-containing protein [Colletotrichum tamarilloi]KAK1503296.1 fungal specific transcription factor domain-containing protein [Colletotrichum tamarilloi]